MSSRFKESERLESSAAAYSGEIGELDSRLVNQYSCQVLGDVIKAGNNVLLLGAGNALVAQWLVEQGVSLKIVEGSSTLVRALRKSLVSVEIVEALFEDFVPGKSFDVVVGSHILEHVVDPVAIIKRTRGWLHEEGTSVFTVPNAYSLHRRIGRQMGLLSDEHQLNERDHSLGHRRVYDPESFQKDLQIGGYPDVHISGYGLKIVPSDMMNEWSKSLLDAIYELSRGLEPDLCSDLVAICRLVGGSAGSSTT